MAETGLTRAIAALRHLLRSLKRKKPHRRDPEPQDPYAYVTAPKKPRRPNRSGAAVAELPDD